MSPSVLLLVLASAGLHATWNYLAKTIPGGAAFVWLLAAIISVWMLPVALWYLVVYGSVFSAVNVVALLVTGLLHLVYFLTLQKGYALADLSVVYPLARGSGPVFTTLGAVWFLGEQVTAWSLVGLALIVTGVVLIAGLVRPGGRSERLRAGVFYGLITGLLIAGYTVFDGFAIQQLAIAPLMLEYFTHPLRVIALAPTARQRWPEVREIWTVYRWKVLAISVMAPLGFILFLYAMQRAPLHLVAPARELSIVLGVVFGAKLLTEENFRARLAGATFIVAGIVFLSV